MKTPLLWKLWAAPIRKIKMFNPNEHKAKCEKYMSSFLGSKVDFIQAELLTKSTREGPGEWMSG
jgi:hypothetical protein